MVRWAWPLVFLLPLTWVAGRGCQFGGVDPAYHAVMWLHEHLPVLYLGLGIVAAMTVAIRVARVRARAAILFSLAVDMPADLAHAVRDEAERLNVSHPRVAYLDVSAPLCFALVGRRGTIVISRGFVTGLDVKQLRLVARHELLHIRYRDPMRGFLWHLAFAAFILPAFDRLENWFASGRELRTNLTVAAEDPEAYATLLRSRARGQRDFCVEAFASTPRSGSLLSALFAPAIVLAVLAGLAASHAWFLDHLAYLSTHHC